MMDFEDNIYKNKFARKTCIGVIQIMNKLMKSKDQELTTFIPKYEEYMISEEYKKLVDDLNSKEEDDEYRNDYDPKGYELYKKSLENPLVKAYDIAVLMSKYNPECPKL